MPIGCMHQVTDTHTLQLRDFNRHMEGLDNYSRCHNLRVWGLPETIDADQSTVLGLFNGLLDRPPTTPIGLECIHRAL